jgi:hypothetical protein
MSLTISTTMSKKIAAMKAQDGGQFGRKVLLWPGWRLKKAGKPRAAPLGKVKKAEGVVSHALSTPSESGYYGVNPR